MIPTFLPFQICPFHLVVDEFRGNKLGNFDFWSFMLSKLAMAIGTKRLYIPGLQVWIFCFYNLLILYGLWSFFALSVCYEIGY